MKITRILAIVLICGLALAASQETQPRPPKIEQKMFSVKGDQPWLNTGFRLRPKDRVTITASGRVYFHQGVAASGVDPNGYQGEQGSYEEAWPNDYDHCFDPLRDANHAALIAEVNNDIFFLGDNKVFNGKDGILVLGINDCTFTEDQVYYNTGQFQVIVKIEHPGNK